MAARRKLSGGEADNGTGSCVLNNLPKGETLGTNTGTFSWAFVVWRKAGGLFPWNDSSSRETIYENSFILKGSHCMTQQNFYVRILLKGSKFSNLGVKLFFTGFILKNYFIIFIPFLCPGETVWKLKAQFLIA